MALPQGISRANFLSPTAPSDGIIHSIAQKGGYQEMITIGERNTIPLFENGTSLYTGFTLSDDIWSSGRRRVGMMVNVVEGGKFYTLIPVGFFGNGSADGETEWLALPEWERALRMDPAGTYCSEGATPANGFTAVQKTATDIGISNDPNGCWVETAIAVDGTDGAQGPQGNPGPQGPSGTPKLFDFWSEVNSSYKVGQDSEYEGGSASNTNPTLYLTKGETYTFGRSSVGHPLNITNQQNGMISAGVVSGSLPVNMGVDLVWKVPQDAQGIYRYTCEQHPAMTGQIVICCGDGVISDDPQPTPVPTATPQPEPTATAIPVPTATPQPEPTATPAESGVQFYLSATDNNGSYNVEAVCKESTDVPIWTSSFASVNGIQANNTETIFTDAQMTVVFSGYTKWYTISSTLGGSEAQIQVRLGAITATQFCDKAPTATPGAEEPGDGEMEP